MTLTRSGVGADSDHRESLRYEPFATSREIDSLIRETEAWGSGTNELAAYLEALELQYYLKGVLEVYQESDALYHSHAGAADVSGPVARLVLTLEDRFGPRFHEGVSDSSVQVAFHQGVGDGLSAVVHWSRKVVTI
ncbi:hypothetical protein RHDE110596_00335 [Prescottella defluvii]|uniref:hypothetical protein n=1 Tax=Prescottella defluvii TaxID=1323361 RepID=UPI0012E00991|nr:hypothetical protein [Prescottella defluvii]